MPSGHDNKAANYPRRRDRAALEDELGILHVKGDTCRCPSPEHEDANPSASIYRRTGGEWAVHCHSCGWDGDVFDVAAAVTGRPLKEVLTDASSNGNGKAPLAKAPATLDALAKSQGVSVAALKAQGTERDDGCFRTPERDAAGNVIGWALRLDKPMKNGKNKISKKGSKRGLTYIHPLPEQAGEIIENPIVIVEGASDQAAGTDLGFCTIGRPSANGGLKHLRPLVKERHVCIVGENDKKPNGRWPGREGAESIAAKLARVAASVKVIYPPADVKDLRAWRQAGLAADELRGVIDAATPWTPRDEAGDDEQPVNLTDLGNAERFALQHGENVKYVHGEGRWLIFTEQRWAPDETGEVIRRAAQTARSIHHEAATADIPKRVSEWALYSESRARLEAMVNLAQSRPGIATKPAELDHDGWAINVANGTLDLHTGKLRKHNRDDLITKLCPVTYDAAATCPRWLSFLDRIMGGNEGLIAYLQRLAGLFLTGSITDQIFPIFYGGGGNGKNVFLDTIAGILGPYAQIAPDSLLTVNTNGQNHPTEIARLKGARLVIASETEEGKRLRVALVKRMTGDKTLIGRFMKKDFFEFERTHKTVLVSNHKPVVNEAKNAIWRRIRLVPFTVTIPEAEQNRKLLEELREEWSGILNWMLNGCLNWQRTGLCDPQEVLLATGQYRDEQDKLSGFIEACCGPVNPDNWLSRNAIREAYVNWAHRTGERHPLDPAGLYDRLGEIAGVAEKWGDVGGRRTRGFSGLSLLLGHGNT